MAASSEKPRRAPKSAVRYSKRLTAQDVAAILAAFNTDIQTLMEYGKHAEMP